MTKKEQLKNDQHYFDLGMMQGKRKFNVSSFLDGLVIGLLTVWIILNLL